MEIICRNNLADGVNLLREKRKDPIIFNTLFLSIKLSIASPVKLNSSCSNGIFPLHSLSKIDFLQSPKVNLHQQLASRAIASNGTLPQQ